jgi:hypothetical protein
VPSPLVISKTSTPERTNTAPAFIPSLPHDLPIVFIASSSFRSRDLLPLLRRMTEDRLDVCRTFVLFLAERTPSFIGVKEVRHSPIHPSAGKRSSRKLACPVYAAFCMSIRSALQATASPSDESIDLASSERRTPARGASRGCGSSHAPRTCLSFMQEDEFPPKVLFSETPSSPSVTSSSPEADERRSDPDPPGCRLSPLGGGSGSRGAPAA